MGSTAVTNDPSQGVGGVADHRGPRAYVGTGTRAEISGPSSKVAVNLKLP